VRPTLEVVLSESPTHLRKRYDPESGLALIAPEADSDEAEHTQGETNLSRRVPDETASTAGEQARRVATDEAATPRGSTEEGAGP